MVDKPLEKLGDHQTGLGCHPQAFRTEDAVVEIDIDFDVFDDEFGPRVLLPIVHHYPMWHMAVTDRFDLGGRRQQFLTQFAVEPKKLSLQRHSARLIDERQDAAVCRSLTTGYRFEHVGRFTGHGLILGPFCFTVGGRFLKMREFFVAEIGTHHRWSRVACR